MTQPLVSRWSTALAAPRLPEPSWRWEPMGYGRRLPRPGRAPELELLVRAGLTEFEALRAATAVAAAKVGAEARLGTVEVGKEAHLVILRESPLEDIRNTREIDLVIKRGRLFEPAELTIE